MKYAWLGDTKKESSNILLSIVIFEIHLMALVKGIVTLTQYAIPSKINVENTQSWYIHWSHSAKSIWKLSMSACIKIFCRQRIPIRKENVEWRTEFEVKFASYRYSANLYLLHLQSIRIRMNKLQTSRRMHTYWLNTLTKRKFEPFIFQLYHSLILRSCN